MKKLSKIFLVLCFLPFTLQADSFDDVVNAMKTSNAENVSKYLNNNVELTLLENENLCSKVQAEQMLKKFFEKHQAKNLIIQHRGASAQGAKYAIANYESNAGAKFRVYIFMKDTGHGMLIHELRVEKE